MAGALHLWHAIYPWPKEETVIAASKDEIVPRPVPLTQLDSRDSRCYRQSRESNIRFIYPVSEHRKLQDMDSSLGGSLPRRSP